MTRARHRARAWHRAWHMAWHRARAGHAVGIDQNFVYIEIDTHGLNKLHILCTPCKIQTMIMLVLDVLNLMICYSLGNHMWTFIIFSIMLIRRLKILD